MERLEYDRNRFACFVFQGGKEVGHLVQRSKELIPNRVILYDQFHGIVPAAIARVASRHGVAGPPGKERYASLAIHLAHIVDERGESNGIAIQPTAMLDVPDVPAKHGRVVAAHRLYIGAAPLLEPFVTIGQIVLMAEHDTLVQLVLQLQVQFYCPGRGLPVAYGRGVFPLLVGRATSDEQGRVQDQNQLNDAISHFLQIRYDHTMSQIVFED